MIEHDSIPAVCFLLLCGLYAAQRSYRYRGCVRSEQVILAELLFRDSPSAMLVLRKDGRIRLPATADEALVHDQTTESRADV